MPRGQGRRQRSRGSIDQLPSGTFRVRVYAGVDPLTGRAHYLREIAATPREAEEVRTRLLNQVDERRQPRSKATVGMVLDRWLEVADVEASTRNGYLSKIETHIRPTLRHLAISKVDTEVLELFYARLRRCREQCNGRRAAGHTCRPLAASSVRQIHFILRGAFALAVRWRWIAVNPAADARPPSVAPPSPTPPTSRQAATMLTAAWEDDPDWGCLLWVAMTSGPRRGELCALRWHDVDFDAQILTIARNYVEFGRYRVHKDTKTHQQRRIALSPESVAVLRAHLQRAAARADAIGAELPPDAFIFSYALDCSRPMLPGTVTKKYARQAGALGIESHLHELRHYSATELLAAGVDLRTIAGRMGHGGGGATTLRVYAAWIPESDRRAASALSAQLPTGVRATSPGDPTAPAIGSHAQHGDDQEKFDADR
jgi:integrase